MPESNPQHAANACTTTPAARCGICQTRRPLHEDGSAPAGWYQSPVNPEWLACPECQAGLLEAARAGRIFTLPPDEVPGA